MTLMPKQSVQGVSNKKTPWLCQDVGDLKIRSRLQTSRIETQRSRI
jgi:hypothetical protein